MLNKRLRYLALMLNLVTILSLLIILKIRQYLAESFPLSKTLTRKVSRRERQS